MFSKASLQTFLSGTFMGTAGLIPGVSSGTVAVIAGVYDKLIESFSAIITPKQNKLKPGIFLTTLLSGMVIATFLFASIIDNLTSTFPNQMNVFFIGLIIGTIPLLYYKANKAKNGYIDNGFNPFYIIPLIICFLLIILLDATQNTSGEPITNLTLNIAILIFISGFLSGGAGIIPGISGSMILLSIGMYPSLIHSLSIDNINWPFLIILASGALSGLICFSKIINCLLNNYYQLAYYSIIGLLLGAAVTIWPELTYEPMIIISNIIILIIGMSLTTTSFMIERRKKRKGYV